MTEIKAKIGWHWYRAKCVIEHIIKVGFQKFFKIERPIRRVGKHRLMSSEEFQHLCIERIESGEPFMATRYGSVEASFLFHCVGIKNGAIKKIPERYKEKLYNNAGFFPYPDAGLSAKYLEVMKHAAESMDVLCYWEAGFQEYLVKKFCRQDIKLAALGALTPFQNDDLPERMWTEALRGKRVLVISPFAETIRKQYANREAIWKDKRFLPEFELYTLKAVQTIAGTQDERFDDWFEALDYMYKEALKLPFDIAVIGCGAYGMPLAALLKQAGKQAIHWGGMLQIWMGIKGARWDQKPSVNRFYNEAWVRPSQEETPKGKGNVEKGCYW